MSETKELIEFVQYLIHKETKADEHKCRKDVRLKYLELIKSILEQQYQHEQNILDYGTDEPEEQQPQPDEELVEALIYASYNFHKGVEFKSKASERIRTLIQSLKPSITRAWIAGVASVLGGLNFPERADYLIKQLKFKGIEVKGEK